MNKSLEKIVQDFKNAWERFDNVCNGTVMINPSYKWVLENFDPKTHSDCILHSIQLTNPDNIIEIMIGFDPNDNEEECIDFVKGKELKDTFYLGLFAVNGGVL